MDLSSCWWSPSLQSGLDLFYFISYYFLRFPSPAMTQSSQSPPLLSPKDLANPTGHPPPLYDAAGDPLVSFPSSSNAAGGRSSHGADPSGDRESDGAYSGGRSSHGAHPAGDRESDGAYSGGRSSHGAYPAGDRESDGAYYGNLQVPI